MPRLRFATAREVLEAFPSARADIRTEPTEVPPLDFVRALIGRAALGDALAFFPYVVPRRDAVAWACRCLRALGAEADEALLRAEAWVREPEEYRRREALQAGNDGDRLRPGTWAALAAAWSGGDMAGGEHGAVPASSDLTAKAARAAVLIALGHLGGKQRDQSLTRCLELGLQLAGGEEAPGPAQGRPDERAGFKHHHAGSPRAPGC